MSSEYHTDHATRSVVTVHHVTEHGMDYYTAAVHIDGQPTTFECTHVHKTSRTAEKCILDVVDAWVDFHGEGTDTRRLGDAEYELSKPGTGSFLNVTRRYRVLFS